MLKNLPILFSAATLLVAPAMVHSGPTLDKVRSAHELHCGVDFEEAEYSTDDAHGNHSGFDIDLCKAFATAALGPNAKVIVVPYRDEQDALKGLKDGEIEVLATGSPNYQNRSAGFGFGHTVFYDYQGLLADKRLHIETAKDFTGKKICFLGEHRNSKSAPGLYEAPECSLASFSFSGRG